MSLLLIAHLLRQILICRTNYTMYSSKKTRLFISLLCFELSCRIQHILDKNPVPSRRIIDQHMGHRTHQFSVLDDWTAAHECLSLGTTVLQKQRRSTFSAGLLWLIYSLSLRFLPHSEQNFAFSATSAPHSGQTTYFSISNPQLRQVLDTCGVSA